MSYSNDYNQIKSEHCDSNSNSNYLDQQNNVLSILSDEEDEQLNEDIIDLNDINEDNHQHSFNTNKRKRTQKKSFFPGNNTNDMNTTNEFVAQNDSFYQSQTYYDTSDNNTAQSTVDIRLPFIIDFFYIVTSISPNGESIKGKCKYCTYEFNCKKLPTSNFSKHAQQLHEKQYIDYLKLKERTKIKRGSNIPLVTIPIPPKPALNPFTFGENFLPLQTEQLQTNKTEKRIFKFIIGSLMGSSNIETKYFKDLIDLIDPTQTISQTTYLDQLVPKYLDECEKNLKYLLQTCKEYSIRIDLFNDLNDCLFAGFSFNAIDSSWKQISLVLNCSNLNKATNDTISALIQSKYLNLLQKFNLKTNNLFKIIINNEHNLYKTFSEWSINGLETLNSDFFNGKSNQIANDDLIEINETNDINDFHLINEANQSLTVPTKAEQSELNKLIEQIVKTDFNAAKIPSVLDILNSIVKESIEHLFYDTNNKSVDFLSKTLKKISKLFSLYSQRKLNLLVNHISDIKSSIYGHKMMPRWCQQFILIKTMFKIETNQRIESQDLEYETFLKNFNTTEKFYLKEFIKLLDPINFMFTELLDLKNSNTTSKIMPCFRTVVSTYQNAQFNLSFVSEIKVKIELLLNNRLDYLNKETVFSLAAVLDPRFGTSWAPTIEKIKIENLLIEQITQNEEFGSINNKINQAQSSLYVLYDESCMQDKQDILDIYKNEIKSYLTHVRTVKSNDQIDPLLFWLVNSQKWLYLAKLAKKVFSVPANNVSIESILQLDKQQCLSTHYDSKIIEQIVLLKCNESFY